MQKQEERRNAGEIGRLLPPKKKAQIGYSQFRFKMTNDSGESSSSKRGKPVRVRREEEQVIRWDRFLSQRRLRVLLVENDDSTRLLVTALLRKCSYQVSAVADGRKAWEVLKRNSQDFDLVLTEMDLPSLSGFRLLSKIMSNERSKNIPVVMMASQNFLMMSSHDSLGIVLKCMLKGAADFLMKPVRKNELRNLWQHAWRKYHATLETVSDNIPASNHGGSDAGKVSRTSDVSDKESDSQRSCGGTEAKNGGSLKLKENLGSENQEIDSESTELQRHVSNDNRKAKGKTTGEEMNVSRSIQVTDATQNTLGANSFNNGSPCSKVKQASRGTEEAMFDSKHLHRIWVKHKASRELIDLNGTPAEQNEFILEDKSHAIDISQKDEKPLSGCSFWELPSWGPEPTFNVNGVFQEKHVLNHSQESAFSRYGGGKIHVSRPTSGPLSVSLSMRTSGSNSANCHKGKSIHLPRRERVTSHKNGGAALAYYLLSSGNKNGDVRPSTSAVRENAYVGHFPTEKSVLPHTQLEARSLPIPFGALPFQNFHAGCCHILPPVIRPKPLRALCGSSEIDKLMESLLSIPSVQDCNHQYINSSDSVDNQQSHQWMQVMKDVKVKFKCSCPVVVLPTSYEVVDPIGSYNQYITGSGWSSGCNIDTSAAIVNTETAFDGGNRDGSKNHKGKGLDYLFST